MSVGLPVGVSPWRDDLTRDLAVQRGIEFVADPHALARASDYPEAGRYPYTVGVALATVGALLDALGYPEHGPDVDQRSWLPEIDVDEIGEAA